MILPENEPQRLEALRLYEIMDTEAEEAFDKLTQLAAVICETPVALVTFLDRDRQWFKSKVGLNLKETPRDVAFCSHAVLGSEVMVVEDATRDERFQNNPLVTSDPKIRFYAGAPLEVAPEVRLGTLCAIDWRPRELSAHQLEALGVLRDQVVSLLRLRHEIARRRAMEEKARENASRLQLVIEQAPVILWTVDSEMRFTSSLGAGLAALGLKPDDVVGKTLAEYLDTDDPKSVPIAMHRGTLSGRPVSYEYLFEDHWYQVRLEPLRDERHRILGCIGLALDITEQRRALDEADQANRAKSDFLANISHEIRTPLNGVIGMSRLLLRASLPPREHRYAERLQISAQSLLELVDDVLDFSKIESGKVIFEKRDFDLAAVLEEVREILLPRARAKKIELTVEAPSDQGLVRGDPVRLRQVLVNLVGNAVKFTDEGRVEMRVEAGVRVLGREAERLFRFVVRDTGIGISDEHRAHLFEPFRQAEESTSRKYGGTGLGLAICKELVELMGGKISVESRPGEGSTFCFTLPLESAASAAVNSVGKTTDGEAPADETVVGKKADGKKANTEEERSKFRILLAEDNEVNRLIALRDLEHLGFRADSVENGTEVLAALDEQHYDLVLMDCRMPELDGFETTRRLRRSPSRARRVPIIALTAFAMKEDVEKCIEAGMNDYLSKPFSLESLEEVIDRWLPAE